MKNTTRTQLLPRPLFFLNQLVRLATLPQDPTTTQPTTNRTSSISSPCACDTCCVDFPELKFSSFTNFLAQSAGGLHITITNSVCNFYFVSPGGTLTGVPAGSPSIPPSLVPPSVVPLPTPPADRMGSLTRQLDSLSLEVAQLHQKLRAQLKSAPRPAIAEDHCPLAPPPVHAPAPVASAAPTAPQGAEVKETKPQSTALLPSHMAPLATTPPPQAAHPAPAAPVPPPPTGAPSGVAPIPPTEASPASAPRGSSAPAPAPGPKSCGARRREVQHTDAEGTLRFHCLHCGKNGLDEWECPHFGLNPKAGTCQFCGCPASEHFAATDGTTEHG
ncbi:hypothetical protein PAPYR_1194 [Paratrimastix pyriformis]|uniref:CCHC-type domain-containing protein n=1 Tax=Paratrimastix pyriformis TaxID=342808 RepID=A0ABQ8UZ35_9EUKA|nr:hypothetical protein PAPYR_1194 [Paratrimastix pyriformis]